jgi:hypothetical protein
VYITYRSIEHISSDVKGMEGSKETTSPDVKKPGGKESTSPDVGKAYCLKVKLQV